MASPTQPRAFNSVPFFTGGKDTREVITSYCMWTHTSFYFKIAYYQYWMEYVTEKGLVGDTMGRRAEGEEGCTKGRREKGQHKLSREYQDPQPSKALWPRALSQVLCASVFLSYYNTERACSCAVAAITAASPKSWGISATTCRIQATLGAALLRLHQSRLAYLPRLTASLADMHAITKLKAFHAHFQSYPVSSYQGSVDGGFQASRTQVQHKQTQRGTNHTVSVVQKCVPELSPLWHNFYSYWSLFYQYAITHAFPCLLVINFQSINKVIKNTFRVGVGKHTFHFCRRSSQTSEFEVLPRTTTPPTKPTITQIQIYAALSDDLSEWVSGQE